MRKWFAKIESRDDALKVIRGSSTVFFALATVQIGFAGTIIAYRTHPALYDLFPQARPFDMVGTALILAFFAVLLRYFNSRAAALALLLLSLAIAGFDAAANAGAAMGGGNLFFAIIAIWASIRATQATFKLHGFAKRDLPTGRSGSQKPHQPPPAADFISHPRGGVELTAATADFAYRSQKPYDKEKWEALLKYDDDIARIAERIRPLGERWLDELARAYLALNDKQYLSRIEEKIRADARAERARSRL